MGDYIIELKNISKCYEGDTAAVDNVSLSIDDPANDRWI